MRSPFPLLADTNARPGARAPLPRQVGRLLGPCNEVLQRLAEEEKAARQEPMTDEALAKSHERRITVARLLYEGAARTSEDYVYAASVFQHGNTTAELERANALANRALTFKSVHPEAKWLAAATDDQLRMIRGEPQRFGTQYCFQGQKWALYRVDPRVTDAERAQWDVPPLALAFEYVESVNAGGTGAACSSACGE